MAQKVKCSPHGCISLVLALLLLSVTVEGQTSTNQTLKDLFEEALLSSNESLNTLQNVFFNPSNIRSPVSVCIGVTVTVDNIQEAQDNFCYGDIAFDCDNASFSWPEIECLSGWYFTVFYKFELAYDDSGTSQLSDLLTNSDSTRIFFIFDPSFYIIMEALSVSMDPTLYISNMDNPASITIHISEDLQQMPCVRKVDDALRMVLVWAKAYAREHGRPYVKLDVDRSLVSLGYTYYTNQYRNMWYNVTCPTQTSLSNFGSEDNPLIVPELATLYFFCIFILSNLLFLSSVILYLRKMFLWLQQQRQLTKSLYKASGGVLTCVNIIMLISDIYLHRNGEHYFHSTPDYPGSFWLYIMVPIVLIIMIIETPLVCYYTHGVNNVCYRIAHAFALCQIIWFGHRLVTDAIISIVFFVIVPAQTLGVVTLLLSVIAAAIAFVAIILDRGFTGCNKKYCMFLFCASCNGIMICGLLFVVTLLFIVFVDNGLRSAGIGGLILSLVPAFAGAVFGLFVQQKFFNSTTSTASVNTTELRETHQTTAIQIANETETHPLLRRPQT